MKKCCTLAAAVVLPFLILSAGLGYSSYYGMKAIPALLTETSRGPVPPGFEIEVDEKGAHAIWLHTLGWDGAERYEGPESLPPGGELVVRDVASGVEIPVKDWIGAEKHRDEERAVALGVFEAERGGQRVEVSATGLFEPVLISVAPTRTAETMKIVFTLLGLVVVSLSIAVAVFLALMKQLQALRSAAPPGVQRQAGS